MKKILALGFLLLDLQQLPAQPLPFYDLSYYDSPDCIKEKANSFAKSTLAGAHESVGRSICEVAKAFGREDMAKRWDTFPPEVRSKCVNELEQAQKTGRIKVVDYRMLESCIVQNDEKIAAAASGRGLNDA